MDRHKHVANDTFNGHKNGDAEDNELLSLAQKQGMNTDIRRSIFVVVMSSDVRGPSPCVILNIHFCRIMLMPVTVCRS